MSNYKKTEWYALLEAEIAATSASQVAKLLDYSITTISLIRNGKYAGKTDKVAERVLAVLDKVELDNGTITSLNDCKAIATGPAPTHNPIKIELWLSCKRYIDKLGATS